MLELNELSGRLLEPKMNIFETEIPLKVMAKICGSKEQNNKRVTYSIIDAYN
jgi:hypothetical protein